MAQKIRQQQILHHLNKNGYPTVKELVNLLHYSSATINRDLNKMQADGLVLRTYGGVEATSRTQFPPLPQRQFFMKQKKRKLAYEGAKLIENGDWIFLDGSTTVQHMIPFLTEKKDLTVITNNMHLAIALGEHRLRVFCLGGYISEYPHVLGSDETAEQASHFHVDKFFFATNKITETGLIYCGATLLYRTLLKNSSETYLLIDRSKVVERIESSVCDFSALTGVISDFEFPPQTKAAFPDVRFLSVEEP